MSWKQPIDTTVLKWPVLERLIFCELMLRARNEDSVIPSFWHGNKYYSNVFLKRGQCIFKVSTFSSEIGGNQKRTRAALKCLINRGVIRELNRKPFGFIVTINNYDDWVSMSNQSGNQSGTQKQIKSKSIVHTSNKNDKNVKSVKRDNNISEETKNFLAVFNELFGSRYRFTSKRADKIRTRLKTYSMEEILLALKRMADTPFYCGKNDRNWVADPDYLIRNDENIDKFLNKKMKPPEDLLIRIEDEYFDKHGKMELNDKRYEKFKRKRLKEEGYDFT